MDIKQMQLELITYVKSMKGATDHGSIEQAINKLSSECPEDVVNVLRAYYRMLLEKAEVPDETYMMGALTAYITDTYKLGYPLAVNDKIEEMASHCPPAIAKEVGLVTTVQKAYRTMCIETEIDHKTELSESMQKAQMSKVHELLRQATYQPSTMVTQTTPSPKTEILSDLDMLVTEVRQYIAEHYEITGPETRVYRKLTAMADMCEDWQVHDYGLHCDELRAYFQMLREKATGFPDWIHLRYYDKYQLPALDTAERRVIYYIRSKYKEEHDGRNIYEIIDDIAEQCPTTLARERQLDTPLKKAYMYILLSYAERPAGFDLVDSAPPYITDDVSHNMWDTIAHYIAVKHDLSDRDSIQIHIQEMAKACPKVIVESKGLMADLQKAYETMSIEVRSGMYLKRKQYVDNDFMFTADENRELAAVLLDRNMLLDNFAAYIMLRDHVRTPEYVKYQIREMALLCPEATVLRKNLADDEESKAYAVMLVDRRSVRR